MCILIVNHGKIGGNKMVQGYCMKCKDKKEMADAKAGKMKNGRECVTGKCPDCGTKMFKIGKME